MVNSPREQELSWSRVDTGRCVVLNFCSDNAVHARGGMFVTSWAPVDFPAITWDLLQGGAGRAFSTTNLSW